VLTFNTIKVQKHNDYNINEYEISFNRSSCILVILCREIRLQLIQFINLSMLFVS
jgi:hypothetical protein